MIVHSLLMQREREREQKGGAVLVTVPPVRLPKIGGLWWTEEVTPRG